MANIVTAYSGADLQAVQSLFREYAASLDGRVCFQSFEEEAAGLPGEYTPPPGRLWLARRDGQAAGCGALRRMAPGIGEMKRLYVRPQFRGLGIGRTLVETIIREARDAGYRRIRLDTLPSMEPAVALYRSLRFRRVPPGSWRCASSAALLMELDLASPPADASSAQTAASNGKLDPLETRR